MASYEGNLGMMELVKFYKKAKANNDTALIDKVKSLISIGDDSSVWDIVQKYLGTTLVGKAFAYESIAQMIRVETAKLEYVSCTPGLKSAKKGKI